MNRRGLFGGLLALTFGGLVARSKPKPPAVTVYCTNNVYPGKLLGVLGATRVQGGDEVMRIWINHELVYDGRGGES